MRVLLALLLLLPTAMAAEGPGVVVLVHHPDDGIDPLGVPFAGSDPFVARHGHLDRFRGGIDYPGFVVDGRVPFDGLPESDEPLEATFGVYNAAVTMRQGVETPVALTVAVQDDVAQVNITPAELGVGVRLWSALVEDPVHYEPPTGLTNGVFDHPFTTRSITDRGPLEAWDVAWNLTVDPAWDRDQLLLAVWLQQDARDDRFKPHEVVQATMHPLDQAEPTVQTARGVLVEAYSATWCDPCLIGDRAIEQLASEHGLQPARVEPEQEGYFQAPAPWIVVLAAGGFALLALVRLPGSRP
ncbi:MAG: hypothetical protein ACPHID_06135 [Thermoplasmatota archaeon]